VSRIFDLRFLIYDWRIEVSSTLVLYRQSIYDAVWWPSTLKSLSIGAADIFESDYYDGS